MDEKDKLLIEEHDKQRDSIVNNLNLEPRMIGLFVVFGMLGYWLYSSTNKTPMDSRIIMGIVFVGFIVYYLNQRSQNLLITLPMARAMFKETVERAQRNGEMNRGDFDLTWSKFDDNPGKERFILGGIITERDTQVEQKIRGVVDARKGRGCVSVSRDDFGFTGDEVLRHE